ncbi:hypothetical protein BVX97_02410 [bacterium E08(2017)]|nr:hypothetical protein BVX97_02410 [bacterium E08(2017)]
MNPTGLIFVAIGIFSMLGGICNWDWFMESRKARFIVKIMTRNGARIFYGILGLAFIVFGALAALGIIDLSEAQ